MKTSKAIPFVIEAVIDFFVWATLVPGLVFATWGGVFNVWQKATVVSGMIMCTPTNNYFSKECFPELYPVGMLELAGITFAVPVL